jgi:hypothetical protein
MDNGLLNVLFRLHRMFLQNPEQLHLRLQRQLPDLVQEDRATVSKLETADAPFQRPGERPFIWPISSLSTRPAEMALQFTFTRARPFRALRLWVVRATSSFPVLVDEHG